MKTKTKTKTEKGTNSFKELETGNIALSDIAVEFNFRKDFNEAKLRELSENIAKVGVLQPVILRSVEDKKILIAGERRYRAAKMAGLETIPYRLLQLTEAEALEVAALENLHRADLSPVEEAQAFKMLLDSGDYQVEDIAQRVDKSKNYVYRSIKILDLPKEAIDALSADKITTGHARQLLRLSKEDCIKTLEEIIDSDMSVKDLESSINWRNNGDLKVVKFPTNKEYAGLEPCNNCQYNTDIQQLLFDDDLTKGHCTYQKCFDKKMSQYRTDTLEKTIKKPEYKGMKNVGIAKHWSYERNFKNYPVIKDGLVKKYAKDMKSNPEKFGVGLSEADLKPVVVLCDPELIKKQKEQAKSSSHYDNYNSEENRFIRDKTDELVREKVKGLIISTKVSKKIYIKAIGNSFGYFDEEDSKCLEEIFKIDDLEDEKKLAKLKEEDLAKLFIIQATEGLDLELATILGHDGDKLQKESEKKAKELWKAQAKQKKTNKGHSNGK